MKIESSEKSTTQVNSILDKLIKENPKEFERALKEYSHVDWFVSKAMEETSRRITPMLFSQAMRRKLEATGRTRWDE